MQSKFDDKASVSAMDSSEFLERLRRSELGRQVLAEREKELIFRRRTAADLLGTAASHDGETAKLDLELANVGDEIAQLASALRSAQAKHRDLLGQKAAAADRKESSSAKARAFLRTTAPVDLLALEALARRVFYAGRFQLRRRVLPGDPPVDRIGAQAMLDRGQAVLREVRELIFAPAIDLTEIDRLRKLLNAPDDLLDGGAEVFPSAAGSHVNGKPR